MRVARWLGWVCSLLVVSSGISAAPADGVGIQRGNDRGVFVNAGWDLRDEATGGERFLIVEASGPADMRIGGALVSVFGSAYTPVTCPGGDEGVRIVDVSAEGPGTATVQPDLSAGALTATLDVTTTVMDSCTGAVRIRVRHHVAVSLALDPAGPIRRESGGWAQHLPSLGLAHQRYEARVRSASGVVTVGTQAVPSGWGEFGRIHGVWHVRAAADAPVLVTQMRAMASLAAESVASSTHNESLLVAGVADFQATDRRMRVIEVDAMRAGDRSVTLSVYSFAYRSVRCENGSPGTIAVMAFGEAPGRFEVGPRLRTALGASTMDLTFARMNECTGSGREWTVRDVPVSFAIAADGPIVTTSEWLSVHTPSHDNERIWIGERACSAEGPFTVGERRYEGSSWAAIARVRIREHGLLLPG